jgi:hypothetical protein
MSSLVYAELKVADCDADFRVNDIPVWRLQHRKASFQAIPVHEFLVDGSNTLRITLAGASPPQQAQASLVVTRYPEGARIGDKGGQVMGRVDLRTPDPAGQPVLSAESSFSTSWPVRWSWQDLAAVDWAAPAARAAVLQFLQEFSRRLQASDAPWLAGALRPGWTSIARPTTWTRRWSSRKWTPASRAVGPTRVFAVAPFAPDDLALRPSRTAGWSSAC